jgi:hypothetical protein
MLSIPRQGIKLPAVYESAVAGEKPSFSLKTTYLRTENPYGDRGYQIG